MARHPSFFTVENADAVVISCPERVILTKKLLIEMKFSLFPPVRHEVDTSAIELLQPESGDNRNLIRELEYALDPRKGCCFVLLREFEGR